MNTELGKQNEAERWKCVALEISEQKQPAHDMVPVDAKQGALIVHNPIITSFTPFVIRGDPEEDLVTINADGTVTFGPTYSPARVEQVLRSAFPEVYRQLDEVAAAKAAKKEQ